MVHAKCGAFVHAMCVLVWGGVRRLLCPAFLKAVEMFPKGNGFTFFLFLQKEPKSMLPRQGQTSCLSGSSRKGTSLFFSLLRKEPKVAEGPRPSRLPENGSKLYRIIFFVLLPFSIPKPAYGATHFLRCFEPVRKGCYSADARLMFFENGMSYCKLTGANVFKKGNCSLSLLRWKFVSCGMLIKSFEIIQNYYLRKKATHSHKPIASH